MTERNRKAILVIGYGRHGKDTVAEMLAQDFDLRVCSTSAWAAERIMMPYFKSIGIKYDTVDACFEDRHTGNNRAVWYDTINAWGGKDKSRFSREVLKDYDIFVGMRNEAELEASKHLYDYIVWVDSTSRGISPEPKTSMTIEYDPSCMTFVDNDGDLNDLREKIRSLGSQWGLQRAYA